MWPNNSTKASEIFLHHDDDVYMIIKAKSTEGMTYLAPQINQKHVISNYKCSTFCMSDFTRHFMDH